MYKTHSFSAAYTFVNDNLHDKQGSLIKLRKRLPTPDCRSRGNNDNNTMYMVGLSSLSYYMLANDLLACLHADPLGHAHWPIYKRHGENLKICGYIA